MHVQRSTRVLACPPVRSGSLAVISFEGTYLRLKRRMYMPLSRK